MEIVLEALQKNDIGLIVESCSYIFRKDVSSTFIVSLCIFVHLVFHQLMHSYILLKYYHRQLL